VVILVPKAGLSELAYWPPQIVKFVSLLHHLNARGWLSVHMHAFLDVHLCLFLNICMCVMAAYI